MCTHKVYRRTYTDAEFEEYWVTIGADPSIPANEAPIIAAGDIVAGTILAGGRGGDGTIDYRRGC